MHPRARVFTVCDQGERERGGGGRYHCTQLPDKFHPQTFSHMFGIPGQQWGIQMTTPQAVSVWREGGVVQPTVTWISGGTACQPNIHPLYYAARRRLLTFSQVSYLSLPTPLPQDMQSVYHWNVLLYKLTGILLPYNVRYAISNLLLFVCYEQHAT